MWCMAASAKRNWKSPGKQALSRTSRSQASKARAFRCTGSLFPPPPFALLYFPPPSQSQHKMLAGRGSSIAQYSPLQEERGCRLVHSESSPCSHRVPFWLWKSTLASPRRCSHQLWSVSTAALHLIVSYLGQGVILL